MNKVALIVCVGSRHWTDANAIQEALAPRKSIRVLTTDAQGADALVRQVCKVNEIPCTVVTRREKKRWFRRGARLEYDWDEVLNTLPDYIFVFAVKPWSETRVTNFLQRALERDREVHCFDGEAWSTLGQ